MNICQIILVEFLMVVGLVAQKDLREGPAISPFCGMRWIEAGAGADERVEVQIDGDTWYVLEQIAEVDTATLLREARRLAGDRWWKRLCEDLPALLDAIGSPVGDRVDLVVRGLDDGERRELPKVAMTHANRQRVKAANGGGAVPAPAASRDVTVLPAAAARADLAALRTLLDERFAYRHLRRVDLDGLLRAAGAGFGDEVAVEELARAVDGVLRAFGDGHSRLRRPPPPRHAAFLPFLVQQTAGGAVAFLADRSALVDPMRPFLVAIDGVPLARWLDAARARGVQGSPALQSREAERGLRALGDLRAELGVAAADRVVVTLRGAAGDTERALTVADRPGTYGAWPRTATGRLDGGIGYLRIAEMAGDEAFVRGLDAAMHAFRDTTGLVIDVRGNPGGTRDALRRLLPYFLPDDAPVITNVAAAHLAAGEKPGPELLANRGLYPADFGGHDDAARTAIGTFLRSFRPSWRLPAGAFSPLCFLVQRRADNPEAYRYGGKVAVLIDRGCFSATDVFAAAFGSLPQVTLVGEATAGGSGRAEPFRLPNSGIELQLSSMASFRPDGVLFEGNGVTPDLEVAAVADDLVGRSDTVLQRACLLLR